jgi:hypothetical protein
MSKYHHKDLPPKQAITSLFMVLQSSHLWYLPLNISQRLCPPLPNHCLHLQLSPKMRRIQQ